MRVPTTRSEIVVYTASRATDVSTSHLCEDMIFSLFVPSAFYPSLGSLFLLHDHFATVVGIPSLFLLTALVVSLGLVLALRLPAPSNT